MVLFTFCKAVSLERHKAFSNCSVTDLYLFPRPLGALDWSLSLEAGITWLKYKSILLYPFVRVQQSQTKSERCCYHLVFTTGENSWCLSNWNSNRLGVIKDYARLDSQIHKQTLQILDWINDKHEIQHIYILNLKPENFIRILYEFIIFCTLLLPNWKQNIFLVILMVLQVCSYFLLTIHKYYWEEGLVEFLVTKVSFHNLIDHYVICLSKDMQHTLYIK